MPHDKITRKEHLIEELKELKAIVIYLAVAFSILATVKSLILIQLGVNNFVHGYVVALVESVALGKIVMLAQHMSVFTKVDEKPLAWAACPKAVVMAAIVFVGGIAEEKIFAHHAADAPIKQDLIVSVTHFFAFVLVFYVLFLIRGLSKAIGRDRLEEILLGPRPHRAVN